MAEVTAYGPKGQVASGVMGAGLCLADEALIGRLCPHL